MGKRSKEIKHPLFVREAFETTTTIIQQSFLKRIHVHVEAPHATSSFPVGRSLAVPFSSYSHKSTNLRHRLFTAARKGVNRWT
jgi:hypothetical protein